MPRYTHFVRTENPVATGAPTGTPGGPGTGPALVLDPLEPEQSVVRFDRFATEDAARAAKRPGDAEVYRIRAETRGPWTGAAPYAVYAIWQVADPARAAAFEESRRALFDLRRRVLPTFAVDWLLQGADDPSRYLVLGLYGDEAGLHLCRDHPAIQRFATHHRPADYTARDLTGLRFFRVCTEEAPVL